MVLKWLSKYQDVGIALLRVGLGLAFIIHGVSKLSGGPTVWTSTGNALAHFGITFLPLFWGLIAALAETLGGLLVIAGFCFRPACILITINMIVATTMYIKTGNTFDYWSRPMELGLVFLSLILIGPGKYSIDKQ